MTDKARAEARQAAERRLESRRGGILAGLSWKALRDEGRR